ncbi:MAG: hypothetical protein M3Y24_12230, partial [Acidobacteriota bacterium]|nr:hypothetical protein [Acidobacteriota bacterium]
MRFRIHMRPSFASFLLCSLALTGSASAAEHTPASALAIHCGSLLDPATDTVMRDVIILTEGGSVKQVTPAASASLLPTDAAKVDVSQGFCLPGLIDVHDHLTADPRDAGYSSLGVSFPRETVTGVRNARVTLLAG